MTTTKKIYDYRVECFILLGGRQSITQIFQTVPKKKLKKKKFERKKNRFCYPFQQRLNPTESATFQVELNEKNF